MVVGLGPGGDVVERLAADGLPAGVEPVDEGLELGVHRVEVDRAGQHDDVGGLHLGYDLGDVVLDAALAPAVLAVVAGGAEPNSLAPEVDLLNIVAGFHRSAYELVAEEVRVASFARGRRNHNYPLGHAWFLLVSRIVG